ncbi:hypothetical protein SDRG_09628 [Saprolegnia diclina VS20]|uniref:Uncharacterized protein n=1 Tax=Saprolegnia diclina (strain VS20) TaxID=1156394 RepID=T0RRC5_SAPDV|nr:hypothetical protein SDRG_09628 [Saprolegnia diclina VS20]EQC32652.1 hypothetical protein SDRG_09628 [Saprolegnia diclina VS20]|eukprot:XP_008613796.1 hypothetical protein SDRG_09628 [Saprolegnia diclina VS20]
MDCGGPDMGCFLEDEPPSEALASYDKFVKWVLHSPPSALDDSAAWPNDFDVLDVMVKADEAMAPSVAIAKIQLAAAESISEELVDTLFELEREGDEVFELADQLELEQLNYQATIMRLEKTILLQLQVREESIADQFALEQTIARLHTDDAPARSRKGLGISLNFGWPRGRPDAKEIVKKDIELHEKLLAHEKLSLAEAKADLDQERFTTRALEKRCARLKLELAAATTTEDVFRSQLNAANSTHQALLTKLSLVPQIATKVYKARLHAKKDEQPTPLTPSSCGSGSGNEPSSSQTLEHQ